MGQQQKYDKDGRPILTLKQIERMEDDYKVGRGLADFGGVGGYHPGSMMEYYHIRSFKYWSNEEKKSKMKYKTAREAIKANDLWAVYTKNQNIYLYSANKIQIQNKEKIPKKIQNKTKNMGVKKNMPKLVAKKVKKLIPGGPWVRRHYIEEGKGKYIWERKLKTGKKIKSSKNPNVWTSSDKKEQVSRKKPQLHGIAKAKRINARRSKQSQKNDASRQNKNIKRATDKNLKAFKKRPGSMDIKGIDTKKRKKR